ncbi:hypothetical protein ACFQPA_13980 [Halomarina halobia]|uniref:Membrane dipeptidase n=1 Tax=Halomarina halobia TaxID=3033386 RepID=A0ABD6A9F2_9EURY|nr:hypothetical protein [Halomarina sp. PSR21]
MARDSKSPADNATGLPAVLDALRERGFDGSEVRAVACDNWRRVLHETWDA